MVRTIVNLHKQGAHPDKIAEWKYLTLAQVYAALAYYYANSEEIENDIATYDAEYDTLEREWEQARIKDRA